MENLPERNRSESGLILSDKAREIAKVVVEINSLIAFQLPFETVCAWASDIERLVPPEEWEKLSFMMDSFKLGHLFYDRQEGIQNVFKSFRLIKKDSNGKFVIMKNIW